MNVTEHWVPTRADALCGAVAVLRGIHRHTVDFYELRTVDVLVHHIVHGVQVSLVPIRRELNAMSSSRAPDFKLTHYPASKMRAHVASRAQRSLDKPQ